MLDLAAKEDAEAEEADDNSETTAANQLRSMEEAMNNGHTDCLLKVRKYTEMLEWYEKNPSRTMRLEDLRQLLLDTIVDINRLKVILLKPQNFAVAAAHAAAAAAAAITST